MQSLGWLFSVNHLCAFHSDEHEVMSGVTMCFVRFLLGVVFPFTKVAGIPRLWQRLGYVGYGFRSSFFKLMGRKAIYISN